MNEPPFPAPEPRNLGMTKKEKVRQAAERLRQMTLHERGYLEEHYEDATSFARLRNMSASNQAHHGRAPGYQRHPAETSAYLR